MRPVIYIMLVTQIRLAALGCNPSGQNNPWGFESLGQHYDDTCKVIRIPVKLGLSLSEKNLTDISAVGIFRYI